MRTPGELTHSLLLGVGPHLQLPGDFILTTSIPDVLVSGGSVPFVLLSESTDWSCTSTWGHHHAAFTDGGAPVQR